MEVRHASMGGMNEPMAMPQAPHSLTEMPPMEALYAAFAGASGDAQHELTLDPAAMNIHDGDEVRSLSRSNILHKSLDCQPSHMFSSAHDEQRQLRGLMRACDAHLTAQGW